MNSVTRIVNLHDCIMYIILYVYSVITRTDGMFKVSHLPLVELVDAYALVADSKPSNSEGVLTYTWYVPQVPGKVYQGSLPWYLVTFLCYVYASVYF